MKTRSASSVVASATARSHPIFEDTDLFVRSVGAETDIVAKEMYTFEDKGGRSLTLAPGTAPTVRAFEENLQGQDRERLVALYIAPIFRQDKPQAGATPASPVRCQGLGSPEPAVDAEVIDLALSFYRALGIEGTRLLINSVGCPTCAPGFVEALKLAVETRIGEMCADCRRALRDQSPAPTRLQGRGLSRRSRGAPTMLDRLCDECAEHFDGLRTHLEALGIAYEIDPRIVRGLDYYTKTAFEFRHDALGAQDAIGGGGRYDGLVEQCGGPAIPGVGLGIGIERVLLVRAALGIENAAPSRSGSFIVTIGDEAWLPGYRLLHDLRVAGLKAEIDYRRRSIRAQMRYADAEGFRNAVILGGDEIARGIATVRDLVTGEQEEVPLDRLVEHLKGDA